MRTYTYGIMPDYETFASAYVSKLGGEWNTYRVRDCKVVGSADYTAPELYRQCAEFVNNGWQDAPEDTEESCLDWVSSVLQTLDITWV